MENLEARFGNLKDEIERLGREGDRSRGYDGQCDFDAFWKNDDMLSKDLCKTEYEELMQDWNSFGIVQPWLFERTLKQRVDQLEDGQNSPRYLDMFKEISLSKLSTESKPEIYQRVRADSEDPILGDLCDDITEEKLKQVDGIEKLPSDTKISAPRRRVRADAKLKKALRFAKNHIKKLFKAKNSKIIHKRYVNCTLEEMYVRMRLTLQSIISEELLVDDLVYYTIGILNLKKPTKLDCKKKVKGEILMFNETLKKFTYRKLEETMQSSSLRVLLRYIISQADESIAETLEHLLDAE
ncbi:unnamed protein product [Moneuplotes crassus]|uniref:Uncharacterized protein n=1 Tax=Euplotes crassus TaxID=5936 RepID=A0AAD1XJB6_EUPCR|nr:unnamed protein product [Moneuplotes crassus]